MDAVEFNYKHVVPRNVTWFTKPILNCPPRTLQTRFFPDIPNDMAVFMKKTPFTLPLLLFFSITETKVNVCLTYSGQVLHQFFTYKYITVQFGKKYFYLLFCSISVTKMNVICKSIIWNRCFINFSQRYIIDTLARVYK